MSITWLDGREAVLEHEWSIPWLQQPPHLREQLAERMAELQRILNLPFVPHPKQAQMYLHTARGPAEPILYGGGMRGGKSVTLCGKAISLARTIPEPGACLLGRRLMTAFRDSTLVTLQEYATSHEFDHNKSDHWFQHKQTGFMIRYAQLGRKEDIQRLGSTEYLWIGVDEAPEVERDVFEMLQTRLSAKLGFHFNVMGLWLTGNPTPGWVKQDFVKKPREGYYYLPALVMDNPYVPAQYIEDQRRSMTDERFKAWILGDWDAYIPETAAIPADMLRAAVDRVEQPDWRDHVWGIDPSAGTGADYTAVWQRAGLVFRRIAKWNDLTMDGSADEIIGRYWASDHRPQRFNIDIDGLGVGLYDILVRAQYEGRLPPPPVLAMIGVHAEGRPTDDAPLANTLRYKNIKSESVFTLRAVLADQRGDVEDDEDVFADLTTPYYDTPMGKLVIEPKEQVKKRLGRSPDDGDALLLTVYRGRVDEIAGRSLAATEELTSEQIQALERQKILADQEEKLRRSMAALGMPVPGKRKRNRLGY